MPVGAALATVVAIETAAWLQRMDERRRYFALATSIARRRGRPLLVAGAPRGWSISERSSWARHGCGDPSRGDVVVDLLPAPECPRNAVVADLCDLGRWRTGAFGAAFASCTLEHVDDVRRAWAELLRVTRDPRHGPAVLVVHPQPWCLFARYGAHRWILRGLRPDGTLDAERLR